MSATNVVGGRGEVWAGGGKLASFRIESGTVTIDRKNACRRTCSVMLTEGELVGSTLKVVPTVATDLFTPFGNELRIYYTKIVNGVETDTLVGVFGISDVDIQDSGADLSIAVDGKDRAYAYGRAGFTDVYTIAASTNMATAIQSLLNSRSVAFTQTFAFMSTTYTTGTTPMVFGPGDDPWAKASDMAASIGAELYMDQSGITTLKAVPDPATAGVAASYVEGNSNTACAIDRKLSNAQAANYIIRDGQGSGISAPVRGIAQDTNPASPTYVNGNYGTVVDYKSSSLYATTAAAQAAANADLLVAQGSTEVTIWTVIPDPQRDVDDVISGTRVRAGIASGTKYVVDSISLGFDPGTLMTMTTRAIAGIN